MIYTKQNHLNKFNFFLLIAFFIIVTLGIVNHEMWRDELQAWLIAKDSLSVLELLENLKYEGHPALWYLCLRLLSKITNSPLIIQLFQLIIATVVAFIFIYYSPFNKLQKTLFCFGYFPLYEYGIISRSYSLGILLVFSFCALFCRKNYSCIYLSIILALLSHTSVYGIMLGFSLAIILGLKIAADDRYLSIRNFSLKRTSVKNIVTTTSIYAFGLLTAIVQITPPVTTEDLDKIAFHIKLYKVYEDNSLSFIDKILKSIIESEAAITGIWRSYAPIPDVSVDRVWGSNILSRNPNLPDIVNINTGSLIAVCISLLLLLFFVIIFSRQYGVLLAYIIGNLSITFFGWSFKLPELRHNGHLFILLIACCWIYLYQTKQSKRTISSSNIMNLCHKYYGTLLTIVLFIQLYAGVKMYSIDLVRPFSSSQKVAQFINNNNELQELTIVGSQDIIVAPISAWLNREIYYPNIQDFGTHTVITSELIERNRDISQRDIIKEIEKLIDRDGKNLLLILSEDRLQETSSLLNIELLESFENSLAIREKYFVYYVSSTSPL